MTKKPTYKELENKIRKLEHLDYEKSFSIINSERNALRALINSITDEIWICDADGNIILVNTAALQGLGFKDEEDVNQSLLSFLTRLKIYTTDGEPRSQNDAPLLRSLKGEILTKIEELVRDPKSGKIRHRMVNSSPIKNTDGRIVGAVAVVRDITQEKEIEKHARKMADLLKETQRLTKVGGWEFDVASGNVTWTDEIYRIYGVDKDFYDPNDIDRDIQFYAPEAQSLLKNALIQAIERGIPYDLELKFNRSDGEQIWVRTIGKPITENGKVKRVHGNFMDITRFKVLENDLERALKTAKSI